jgi:hypothetical protein
MTNRHMVKEKGRRAAGEMPKPNRGKPQPMPAPESGPPGMTLVEPLDSPQPKPMIRQDKAKGLKTRG